MKRREISVAEDPRRPLRTDLTELVVSNGHLPLLLISPLGRRHFCFLQRVLVESPVSTRPLYYHQFRLAPSAHGQAHVPPAWPQYNLRYRSLLGVPLSSILPGFLPPSLVAPILFWRFLHFLLCLHVEVSQLFSSLLCQPSVPGWAHVAVCYPDTTSNKRTLSPALIICSWTPDFYKENFGRKWN